MSRQTYCRKPLLGLALFAILSACTDSSGPPPQPVVTPVDQATAGGVTAAVTYSGEVPEPIEISMRAAAGCAKLHTEPVFEQPVQVNGGKLANTLVYVKSGLGDRAFRYPTDPVVIDQRGCLYDPRVAALMVGQPLQFVNSDREPHNVRGQPSTVRAWNFMMSRQKATRTLHFDKQEIGIRVGCDVHPWMRSYVSVLSHPYFAITDSSGRATINNLPPGEYTIGTWHETLGEKEQKVVVGAKESKTIEIGY